MRLAIRIQDKESETPRKRKLRKSRFKVLNPASKRVTRRCVGTKKTQRPAEVGQKAVDGAAKPTVRAKIAMNAYLRDVLVKNYLDGGAHTQKELADKARVKTSHLNMLVKKGGGMDTDVLDRLADFFGMSFQDFAKAAIEWYPHRKSIGPVAMDLRHPHRRAAELAAQEIGLPADRVSVWADDVYRVLPDDEDPAADWVVARILLEKIRNPEAKMTAMRPETWHGWVRIRDEMLLDGELFYLRGYLLWFGETPTTQPMPKMLTKEALSALVKEFAAAHPVSDDNPALSALMARADEIFHELARTHPATEPPSSMPPENKADTHEATLAPTKIAQDDNDR